LQRRTLSKTLCITLIAGSGLALIRVGAIGTNYVYQHGQCRLSERWIGADADAGNLMPVGQRPKIGTGDWGLKLIVDCSILEINRKIIFI